MFFIKDRGGWGRKGDEKERVGRKFDIILVEDIYLLNVIVKFINMYY